MAAEGNAAEGTRAVYRQRTLAPHGEATAAARIVLVHRLGVALQPRAASAWQVGCACASGRADKETRVCCASVCAPQSPKTRWRAPRRGAGRPPWRARARGPRRGGARRAPLSAKRASRATRARARRREAPTRAALRAPALARARGAARTQPYTVRGGAEGSWEEAAAQLSLNVRPLTRAARLVSGCAVWLRGMQPMPRTTQRRTALASPNSRRHLSTRPRAALLLSSACSIATRYVLVSSLFVHQSAGKGARMPPNPAYCCAAARLNSA
jgi:hypothetical protein